MKHAANRHPSKNGHPPARAPRQHFACVVGARPNFMKMAPILRALEEYPDVKATLIHTGQHYDKQLSDVFFDELEMPRPDICLQVGSGKHGAQTAKIIERFEAVLEDRAAAGEPFTRTVVVGDVNSTMACALAAVKLGIPVAHVEAGLRSFDRSMPEEINRIVTDSISDMLLVSEPSGVENLRREGHPEENIHLVGNVMIDTLLRHLPKAQALGTLEELGLKAGEYGVVTLHRPSNVDAAAVLEPLLDELIRSSRDLPLVFAVHPRTAARLDEFGLRERLEEAPGVRLLPPLGYLPFLCLTSQARVIVTDSGGLQEESTALGVPCLTLRPNTERPITTTLGTSILVGNDILQLRRQWKRVREGESQEHDLVPLWDGSSAPRIAVHLAGLFAPRRNRVPSSANRLTASVLGLD